MAEVFVIDTAARSTARAWILLWAIEIIIDLTMVIFLIQFTCDGVYCWVSHWSRQPRNCPVKILEGSDAEQKWVSEET